MPGIKKIQRQDIINAAMEILKESSIDNIQARTLAKKLNCSTQPIFYQFHNMEEVKQEVKNEIIKVYNQRMLIVNDTKRPYKEMGRNYLKFAKEEPQFFKLLFMSKEKLPVEKFMSHDKIYQKISENLKYQVGIQDEFVKDFHLHMWIYTHGIACLIATNTCDFNFDQIEDLLTNEYKALVLLEIEKKHIDKSVFIKQFGNEI